MSEVQWPFSFGRLNRRALDSSEIFASLAEFEAYLTSGPAYVGQICAVRNATNIPDLFRVNEDFTYSEVGGGDGADIAAHNTSTTAHQDIRSEISALEGRVDGLEGLGSWAGTFDTYAAVPINISGFASITKNDFIYIREDENHGDLYARYFVEDIDQPTGDITWGFDRTWVEGTGGTADQIATGNALTVTQAAGGWPVGATIAPTDTVWDVIRRLLNPVVPPTYLAPTLTLAGTTPLAREIGESITPTLTPTFNQRDGGAIEEYRLSRDASVIYSGAAAVADTDTTFQLVANVTYQAAADYEEGPIKNDSENNPHPAGQIAAGTITSASVVYTPQRRAFFGPLVDATEPDNSAFIRALANSSLNPGDNTQMTIDVVAGNRGVCFAYPDTLRPVTSIVQQGLGMDVKSGFESATVSVEGASGFTAINYRVYWIITEFPFAASERYVATI